jgi:hypothetical protein
MHQKKLKGKYETFFIARKWQRPIFVLLPCWVYVVTQESCFFLIQDKTTDLLLHRLTIIINKTVIFLKGEFSFTLTQDPFSPKAAQHFRTPIHN